MPQLQLVLTIVKKRYQQCLPINLLDLIQKENLGLLKPAEQYGLSFSFHFSTYTIW